MIEAYDAANRSQEQAKGAAQQATRDQDAALKELDLWYRQYIKIARVALRDKKELLEKIPVNPYYLSNYILKNKKGEGGRYLLLESLGSEKNLIGVLKIVQLLFLLP